MSIVGRVTFSITAEDIAKGRPGTSLDCPAALALTRRFQQPNEIVKPSVFLNVRMGHTTSRVLTMDGEEIVAQNPHVLSNFVLATDGGKHPAPIENVELVFEDDSA